jgi:hypothetical protein
LNKGDDLIHLRFDPNMFISLGFVGFRIVFHRLTEFDPMGIDIRSHRSHVISQALQGRRGLGYGVVELRQRPIQNRKNLPDHRRQNYQDGTEAYPYQAILFPRQTVNNHEMAVLID